MKATALALMIVAPVAMAQTSYINPNYGGGYTIQTPGQGTTYVNPNYRGGYTITTPGSGTSHMMPNYSGGYTITTPGVPSYSTPDYSSWGK